MAEWLAAGLDAEIEEIVEQRPRDFAFRGIFRSGLDSLFRRRPPIEPMAHREAIYDRVILCLPGLGRPHRRAGAHLARTATAAAQASSASPSNPATAPPIPAVLGEFEEHRSAARRSRC